MRNETQEQKEARWKRQDEIMREGMKTGNPYASLCLHCYGRHWSPKDDECPHESIDDLKRRLSATKSA